MTPLRGSVVWVAESGAYAQRAVWSVSASPEAGIAALKAVYGTPYVVRWEAPVERGAIWSITGHFAAVAGYSTEHSESWDFEPYEVIQ